MTPLLAILIPYTPDRQRLYERVTAQIKEQILHHPVIIIPNEDRGHRNGGKTTGQKRNELLDSAREAHASHIAFVDSDDLVSDHYIETIMPAVYGNFDTASLWGQYYEQNRPLKPFHHSLKYDHWWEDNQYYYRCNNHLNIMRLDKVKDFKFLDRTFGEDGNWSMDIQNAKVLKTEYQINEIIYYYFAGRNKNHDQEPAMAKLRGTKL
jgi:hypothetical protein